MAQDIAKRMRDVQETIDTLQIRQHGTEGELVTAQQYGLVTFDEKEIDSNTRLSQYIRLSLDTSAEKVVQFMQHGWRLPTPDLIISVTGGAKSFEMSARLRKVFQRGLVAAAVTTNAWLITAGTNAGVVKEVGEALSNYRYKNRKQGFDVPCIGIGSWGYTAGNEQLEGQAMPSKSRTAARVTSRFMAKSSQAVHALYMDIGNEYFVRKYIVKESPKKRCDLEANHTHFLLFDDGQPNADAVLALRADIEKRSRHIKSETSAEEATETLIPIVMVLIEGGPSSCRTICQALESSTPVVVIKESGRAADLVAELHACYSEGDSNGAPGVSRPQTGAPGKMGARQADIDSILTKARAQNAWVEEVRVDLCRILNERKKLVTIFKFDDKRRHNGNLEDAILEALLNAARYEGDQNEQQRRIAELKLAMAWDKFGYAKKHLLTDTTISQWKVDDLRRALLEALRRGHVEFVELLIEFGTSLETLTYGDLKNLYNIKFTGSRLPLKKKSKLASRTQADYYMDYFRPMSYYSTIKGEMPSFDDSIPLGQNGPRELFLWALFLDRFELATYLCSKTRNSSISPLLGSQIYHRASRLELDIDTKKRYSDNAGHFDAHATSIIDRCFDNDENFAVDIIKRPAASFYDVHPLQLAQKSDSRSFLASKCVQRHLDNTWFGFINYKRTAIDFRVFLCTLFFPLLPIFCVFLPYIRKHKQIARSPRDYSKTVQPIHIQTVVETGPRRVNDQILWSEKFVYFYKAPIVRFYYYMIFFICFLLLFSFVLLVDYFPLNNDGGRRSGVLNLNLPITETILHICIWSLITEEIRQFVFTSFKRDYFSEIWNIIDIIAIILYLIGFITRFFVLESLFTISKICLCIDLVLWFVRTLHLFAAYEKLGPKLVMIFNTMKDLLFFICFIAIFLLAYSIASWALLNTDNQVTWNYNGDGSFSNFTILNGGSGLWSWALLRNVTNFGVWKIFGQVDPIDGSDSYADVTFVLTILFVAVSNVLLLNVLVALFNLTIQGVQSQSHKLWRYQRYRIVFDYYEKPPLPPPFNNIYYVFVAIRFVLRKIVAVYRRRRLVSTEAPAMNSVASNAPVVREEFKVTDLMQRESAIADDYWRMALKQGKKDQMEQTLQNIERRLHALKDQMQNNNNQVLSFEHQLLLYDD